MYFVAAWLAGAWIAAAAHGGLRGGDAVLSPSVRALLGATAVMCLVRLLGLALRADRPVARRTAASVTRVGAATFFAAALLLGDALWRLDARCLRALAAPNVPLVVRLHDAAGAGAWVRGDARGLYGTLRACRVPATLAVVSGKAAAGAWVFASGDKMIGGRFLRLDAVELTPAGSLDWIRGWRGRTGTTIDTLFGARAPLVRALLVADQHAIAPEVRDRFSTAGLVHVLSISGLHVAIIATALRTIAAALRARRATAELAAVAGVGVYVTLLGFPAPATRAATMLVTMLLARRLSRPVHTWTALALGVVLPALDPRVVASLGWQLSASGMAALVAARGMLRRWRTRPLVATPVPVGLGAMGQLFHELRRVGPRLAGWRLLIVRELSVGVMASLITAPLVAWAFGRVSLVAPLTNIVAAPIVSFLQPTLFLALVLAPFGPLGRWVADSATVPLVALDIIARTASDLPFAALEVAPGRLTAVCMGVLMASLVVATARRRVLPPLLVGAGALVVSLWAPALWRGPGTLELHVVDVGQGDALAIRTPRGRWILVDAGRVWEGGDAGRRTVIPYVRRRGGEVALFVLTHPDADHVGGAPSVLDGLRPARWWDPGFVHGSDVYARSLEVARQRDIPWRRAQAGDSLWIDGVLLRVLAPDPAWMTTHDNANDASIVLMLQHGQVRMLLTGDAEAAEEAWLVDRWGDALSAQVLKVGHHGSRTSSTDALLDAVHPELALISVGADNRYGHPAPDVMARLRGRGIEVLRTDRDGAIVVRSDGRRISLETRHTAWTHEGPCAGCGAP